ncbi:hypothetical protein [Brucella sp. LJL56]
MAKRPAKAGCEFLKLSEKPDPSEKKEPSEKGLAAIFVAVDSGAVGHRVPSTDMRWLFIGFPKKEPALSGRLL